MREVGGENEGVVACLLHRVAQSVIVAVEAYEDLARLYVTAKIFARHHIGLRAR